MRETGEERDPPLMGAASAQLNRGRGVERGNGDVNWDVLLSWCSVEARVEAGRYDGVAHVGECAKLEDARAGSTRL